MKKVLLFTQIYPPQQGGAATLYSNLVQTKKKEIEFFIISEYVRSEETISRQDGATLYRVLPQAGWLPRSIQAPLEAVILFLISTYLTVRHNLDIIHSHASRGSIIGLAIAATILQTAIVYDCHDTGFRTQIIKRGPTPIWFSCAPYVDRLLVESDIPEDRIVRLPILNPKYVSEYRSTEVPRNPRKLIFIGSLVDRKGIFLLLSSLKIMRDRGEDIHLTVIGDGPDRTEFEKHCQTNGLNDYVTLTGSLSHKKTLKHLADADILVLPSEMETVGRVLLEGQDVGTPVVATSVGGIPDVIDHTDNGMLAEETAESVAENVLRLIYNRDLYVKIMMNGFKSADERSWKRAGEQLLKGYNLALMDEDQDYRL